MLDIKFVRENPDAVKENIKKKFQDAKLPLVDEVIEKDAQYRAALKEVEALKAARNKLSKANGPLFGQLKKCDDEAKKAELQAQIDANNAAVKADADKMAYLENYCLTHSRFSFRSLLEAQAGKMEIIVTFLAILELMKTGKIFISQEHTFDDILIQSKIVA